jgi:hypothetical protein
MVGTAVNMPIIGKTLSIAAIPEIVVGGFAIGMLATGGYELVKNIPGVKVPGNITKMLILFLALSMVLGGCGVFADNPNAQLVSAYNAYTSTVNGLTTLQKAGKFTPDQTEHISVLVHIASGYLDQWYEANKAGQKTPPDVLSAFNDVLEEMIRIEAGKQ